MKKSKILNLFIVVLMLFFTVSAEAKTSKRKLIKKLDPKYRKWLNVTAYISTKDERETFLKLTNNRDRDIFINMFWKQRDPSKGTPQNEYKDEHMKRFNFANKRFKYGSPIPGWKTDRGRIYILLGEPVSQQEVKSSNNIYPFLTWNYYGSLETGLPTAYRVSFYKPHGAGQYKLFTPGVVQPGELLRVIAGSIDLNDNAQVYEKLAEHESEVAEAAFSMIPGEKLYNYTPSLQSPILMSKIYEQPKKKIKATYARNFLAYKGVVDIKSFTNYINCQTDVKQIYNKKLGMNFIHVAVRPEHVSVDYSEDNDKFYYSFNMTILLSDKKSTIFKYNKNFSAYYTKEELNSRIANGLILTDTFPVVPGEFAFRCIVENVVNSEIFYYEKDLKTNNYKQQSTVTTPLISYNVSLFNQPATAAFVAENHNFKVDTTTVYGKKEPLKFFSSASAAGSETDLQVVSRIFDLDEKLIKTFKTTIPAGTTGYVFETMPVLPPADYRLENRLIDNGNNVIKSTESSFTISHTSVLPHPAIAMRKLPYSRAYIYKLMLAQQYQNTNNRDMAALMYEETLKSSNYTFDAVKNYINFLAADKKHDKILELVPHLKDKKSDNFLYHKLKGTALYNKKMYPQAIIELLEANKIYDSDIQLLNILGVALLMDKRPADAIKPLRASLKLHEKQPHIKKLVKQIEEKMKK